MADFVLVGFELNQLLANDQANLSKLIQVELVHFDLVLGALDEQI